MGNITSIAWTDHTFNPWIGCTRVSPGCQHCYAEALDRRWGHARWGPGAKRERTKAAYWKQPIKWNADAVAAGKRARVFCASLADVFDVEVPDLWRFDLFDVIRSTPMLDWQLLTKRPENFSPLMTRLGTGAFARASTQGAATHHMISDWVNGEPPPNVWFGITVEDPERAALRIPIAKKIPAALRFLSIEPMLHHISLDTRVWGPDEFAWIIVGGESGAGARPFSMFWARDMIEQGRKIGAAVFVKQMGSNAFDDHMGGPMSRVKFADSKGGDPAEWPEYLRVREFPADVVRR